jgi:predicted hotdog family 3-hydroxylacyl-ACP dehydratase
MSAQTYPAIVDLVPHAGAMVLLDALTEWQKGYARCSALIREHAPFVKHGSLSAEVTIEYMAQAVAACLGYEAITGGGGVRVGMIIACKRFEAHAEKLNVGDRVEVEVRCISGNEALSHFDCKLTRAGILFSEATLTLYHADSLPQ